MSIDATPARRGSLGRRLVIGASLIALTSIAVLALTTLILLDLDIGSSGHDVEVANQRTIVSALRSAYLAHDSWSGADTSPAVAIAVADGYGLSIHQANGNNLVLVKAPADGRAHQSAISAEGSDVGTATVSVPASGLSPADRTLRSQLIHSVLLAAGLSFVLAVVIAMIGSRRIVAPVKRLSAAARRLGSGDRTSRVGDVGAPGELGDLAEAFDTMADQLQREDDLRRAVVADVAHELRTPLAVLQGEIEALNTGVVQAGPDELRSLDEEVRRLVDLVDDLGVLASAEAAVLTLERHPTRLDEVVGQAADRLQPRFARQHVQLVRHLVPVVVDGDARRLDQIAINLLTNALKFSPSGGEVTVSLWAAGGQAQLTVTDDGPGIAPGEQDRIFERFYRGSAASDSAGSGIGLAVVGELVAAHGGSVGVTSEPGHGATFCVALPADDAR
jgi:two-component system sensor histidine kinase BaeS